MNDSIEIAQNGSASVVPSIFIFTRFSVRVLQHRLKCERMSVVLQKYESVSLFSNLSFQFCLGSTRVDGFDIVYSCFDVGYIIFPRFYINFRPKHGSNFRQKQGLQFRSMFSPKNSNFDLCCRRKIQSLIHVFV